MPFLRSGHSIPSTLLKSKRRTHRLGLLTLCSLSAPSLAHAKPFRAVGVKAWTSGSETFIRARPSADVPPVAKVTRHTPLYVWGKYNGWYRVETHDHIFGWVFNRYIEAPKDYKVRAMPASKARLASNRTANQTMYGSPDLLKKHFVAYGAGGALKGLQKQGIRLAVAPKPKLQTATKPKVLIAKATKPVISKPFASKPSFKKKATQISPRLAIAPREAIAPRIASAPREIIAPKTTVAAAQRPLSPVPAAERTERRAGVKPSPRIVAKPAVKIARAARIDAPESATTRQPLPAPRLDVPRAGTPRSSAPRIAKPRMIAPPVTPPRAVESGQIASSARSLTPSAKFFARAASQEALRRDRAPQNSAGAAAPLTAAPLTDSNFEPIPFKAPVSIAPVAPRVKISAPAPRKVAKKAGKKAVARKGSRGRYASRKERQRQQLRAKMGMSSAAPHSVIAPVSPSELMRARQDYLAARRARLGMPVAPTETPVVGLAPLPLPSGPLGGPATEPSNALPPMPPTGFAPMSYEPSHPLAPLLGNTYILALAQLKPKIAPELTPVSALKPLGTAIIPTRGGSPRDRAMPLRGGSPRDRMGSGMASQALSYRGMPYIRGAASPSRGFDCSGLVYFLLRQRGFNPPRTAAGYRGWGQGVAKNQLKSGDLLLFANTYKRGISHIGVYLGEGKFVHAATSSTGVRVSSLNEAYYRGKYFGARRAK